MLFKSLEKNSVQTCMHTVCFCAFLNHFLMKHSKLLLFCAGYFDVKFQLSILCCLLWLKLLKKENKNKNLSLYYEKSLFSHKRTYFLVVVVLYFNIVVGNYLPLSRVLSFCCSIIFLEELEPYRGGGEVMSQLKNFQVKNLKYSRTE